ncbi:hypothetical protein GRS96_06365 [Rathayibacter sp. VKM Ac-2803]|uniref:hypothetical protein n=1 Tax=Rathayibacter sp. VKM Ac-2803 TaxID=2609256 RepID=UPI0013597B28|nr:hypothetical protein [Rathayibacter sp. VKM Ac-2803]MWV48901.1 hypothetical protein [Rathayibacter sp. VKM Ac-2803]
MIEANKMLFQQLVSYSGERGYNVTNANAVRWVHANDDADAVLIGATLRESMSFGRFRHLAWLEFDKVDYVCSVGFEGELRDPNLLFIDDVQGFDVCLLTELRVSPNASAVKVYNIVEASSRDTDSAYVGHDNALVTGLYPPIKVYRSVTPISSEVVWSSFLDFSANELEYGGSWIDKELAGLLSQLAQKSLESLPYAELCRSTLELDPRSLFMSLYRCIEATYAHDKASMLKNALSIEASWNEIASVLEKQMSWRPLEETSLISVLSLAKDEDLREICACLGVNLTDETGVQSAAGRAIYKLRNHIVHYRPAHSPVKVSGFDWNRICKALLAIAEDVFVVAYGKVEVSNSTT